MPARSLSPTNMDVLRLLAVGTVVVGNGLVLTGGVPPGLWGAPLPRIGLDLLFSIAGFSAAANAGRGTPARFLLGRARRVFPALFVAVVLTAFGIGLLATTLPRRAYLLARETRQFLSNAVLVPDMFLPRAFEGQQWSGAANPMLWTLTAYALGCLALLPLARARRPAAGALLLAALCAGAALAWPSLPADAPRLLRRADVANAMPELPFFFVGAALGFAERAGVALGHTTLWRTDLALLCYAATWIAATWLDANAITVLWLTLPYMALCFGRATLPGLRRVWHFGRPDYGMYLYAFPLQQLIVARWPVAHPVLLCLALSAAAGVLSWFLVERPALRWRAMGAVV